MYKPFLLVDFDGVIHSYSSGWQGARRIPDMPVTGALEFLAKATYYFKVNIYSSRSNQFGGIRAMKKWLYNRYAEIGGIKRTGYPPPLRQFNRSVEIPEVPKWYWDLILSETSMEPWEYEIDSGVRRFLKILRFPKKKPPAFLTIDDRCFCFKGIFPDAAELLKFLPWYKQ